MALGAKLKAARLEKGLTTSQVASATRMKIQIVEDIEREDFSKVAAVIYGKGFIRLYAEQVGLNPGPLIEDYLAHYVASPRKRVTDSSRYGREDDFSEDDDIDDDDVEEEQEDGEQAQEGPDLVTKIAAFFRKTQDAEEKTEDGEVKQSDAERAIQAISEATLQQQPVRHAVPPAEQKRSAVPVEKPAGRPGAVVREPVAPKPVSSKQPSSSATLFDLKADVDAAGQGTEEPDFFTHIKAATDEIKTAKEKEVRTPVPAAPAPATVSRTTPKREEPVRPARPVVRPPSIDFNKLKNNLTAGITAGVNIFQKFVSAKCDTLKRVSTARAGDLKIFCRKMMSRLPDVKIFELSLNSVPVMIVILIIIILTISGLSSLVRRSGREAPEKQQAAVETPVESFDQLRIAIEPPEPYYK